MQVAVARPEVLYVHAVVFFVDSLLSNIHFLVLTYNCPDNHYAEGLIFLKGCMLYLQG